MDVDEAALGLVATAPVSTLHPLRAAVSDPSNSAVAAIVTRVLRIIARLSDIFM